MIMKKLIATPTQPLKRPELMLGGIVNDAVSNVLSFLTLGDIARLHQVSKIDRYLVDGNPHVKSLIKFLGFLHHNRVQYPKAWGKLMLTDPLLSSQLNTFKRVMGDDISTWRVNPMQVSLPSGWSGKYILLDTIDNSDTLYGWFSQYHRRLEATMIRLGKSYPVEVTFDSNLIVDSVIKRTRDDRVVQYFGVKLSVNVGVIESGFCRLFKESSSGGFIKEWSGIMLKEDGLIDAGPCASYQHTMPNGKLKWSGITIKEGGGMAAGSCDSYKLTRADGTIIEWSGITLKEGGRMAAGSCDSFKQTSADGAITEWSGITLKEGGDIAAGLCASLKISADGASSEWSGITIKELGGMAAGSCDSYKRTRADGASSEWSGITIKEGGDIAAGLCASLKSFSADGAITEWLGLSIKDAGYIAAGPCASYRVNGVDGTILERLGIAVKEGGVLDLSPDSQQKASLSKRPGRYPVRRNKRLKLDRTH